MTVVSQTNLKIHTLISVEEAVDAAVVVAEAVAVVAEVVADSVVTMKTTKVEVSVRREVKDATEVRRLMVVNMIVSLVLDGKDKTKVAKTVIKDGVIMMRPKTSRTRMLKPSKNRKRLNNRLKNKNSTTLETKNLKKKKSTTRLTKSSRRNLEQGRPPPQPDSPTRSSSTTRCSVPMRSKLRKVPSTPKSLTRKLTRQSHRANTSLSMLEQVAMILMTTLRMMATEAVAEVVVEVVAEVAAEVTEVVVREVAKEVMASVSLVVVRREEVSTSEMMISQHWVNHNQQPLFRNFKL